MSQGVEPSVYVQMAQAEEEHCAPHGKRLERVYVTCCRRHAGYLRNQDIPLVIVSHDREFLDQLCTKIVETEHGRATSYKGNYTQYVAAKAEKVALQWAAYEKQQKEIARQVRAAFFCHAL